MSWEEVKRVDKWTVDHVAEFVEANFGAQLGKEFRDREICGYDINTMDELLLKCRRFTFIDWKKLRDIIDAIKILEEEEHKSPPPEPVYENPDNKRVYIEDLIREEEERREKEKQEKEKQEKIERGEWIEEPEEVPPPPKQKRRRKPKKDPYGKIELYRMRVRNNNDFMSFEYYDPTVKVLSKLILTYKGQEIAIFRETPETIYIGREKVNQVRCIVDSDTVTQEHAVIGWMKNLDGGFYIQDLGTLAGTYIEYDELELWSQTIFEFGCFQYQATYVDCARKSVYLTVYRSLIPQYKWLEGQFYYIRVGDKVRLGYDPRSHRAKKDFQNLPDPSLGPDEAEIFFEDTILRIKSTGKNVLRYRIGESRLNSGPTPLNVDGIKFTEDKKAEIRIGATEVVTYQLVSTW
eukprot:TRINITY_DN8279_c0_g1_i6.p1 TRINITY_DN8279_c0_g1~~TRINITY_DN8279_c0_g1_i6.p1  ORF type:complete len:406 (+),score=95.68 TRINITY_DN8279_c0_g1_i6:108-1325(+)